MTKADDITSLIASMPSDRQAEIFELLSELEKARTLEGASSNFLPYVKYLWPDFVEGAHHRTIANLFDDIIEGRKKRVIINMAPRHTKSEFASIYLPSYFLGRYPKKKIIQTSHTADLATGFGRKVRNIINGADYSTLFPNVRLSADSKAAGRWATNQGGEYFAIGVGGAVAGKGADLFIIDDPVSEQEGILGESNPEVYHRVMEWYETGPRQRLQPGGAIVVVMTRWSLRDLTGQLIKKQIESPGSDTWEVVTLPAILPEEITEEGTHKPERSIWPQFWKLDELKKVRASIPVARWNAQYQQNPTSEEGALIKREYWQDWDGRMPKFSGIIQSWDTAFTQNTRSDYSACTTWGIFFNEELGYNCLMLIDAIRGKWEFPELKKTAKEHYHDHEPDICLIEARGAGHPLVFEMRNMGLPVQDVTIAKGKGGMLNDKISRVNAITDIFASKMVFARKTRHNIQEVIEECAAFPAGEHDDYVDTVSMALTRYRQGGWIGTEHDYEEHDDNKVRDYEYY